MARSRSEKVQFVTSLEIRVPFGTIISEPSWVWTTLARIPIFLTVPIAAPHLNHVTDFDRSLEEHNQAGHKIINYVLQTEADANAECSRQDREFCHIHAQCRQCDKETDHQHGVVEYARNGIGQTTR